MQRRLTQDNRVADIQTAALFHTICRRVAFANGIVEESERHWSTARAATVASQPPGLHNDQLSHGHE